jgi:hypothetical protein
MRSDIFLSSVILWNLEWVNLNIIPYFHLKYLFLFLRILTIYIYIYIYIGSVIYIYVFTDNLL